MYKFIFILTLSLICTACSISRSHVGEVIENENGEYSIKQIKGGFIISGHWSNFQFVRNSQKAFMACTDLINDAAREKAKKVSSRVRYPRWREVDIIDHGRGPELIMRVNCQYEYRYNERSRYY